MTAQIIMAYPVSADTHFFPRVPFHPNPVPPQPTYVHAPSNSIHIEKICQNIHSLTQDCIVTKQTCQNIAQSLREVQQSHAVIQKDMYNARVAFNNLVQFTSTRNDECAKQERIRASDVQKDFEASLEFKMGGLLKTQQRWHTDLIDQFRAMGRTQLQEHTRAGDAQRVFEASWEVKIIR